MPMTALPTITPPGAGPCPSKWVHALWHICTVECYAAVNKDRSVLSPQREYNPPTQPGVNRTRHRASPFRWSSKPDEGNCGRVCSGAGAGLIGGSGACSQASAWKPFPEALSTWVRSGFDSLTDWGFCHFPPRTSPYPPSYYRNYWGKKPHVWNFLIEQEREGLPWFLITDTPLLFYFSFAELRTLDLEEGAFYCLFSKPEVSTPIFPPRDDYLYGSGRRNWASHT